MRAFVRDRFGPPEVLELREIDTPVPGDDEVLVRVKATSVQPYDSHLVRGEPRVARLMGGDVGFRTPKLSILGADVAGRVEAVGRDVAGLRPGDEVFALLKQGGFGEYVCVRERELAPKPVNLSFEQAAAVPLAACSALLGLRDQGRLQAGQRVLVTGASGGVGTFAVQLARAFGAEVTGVCGPRNTELVRSIGASEVIDYTEQDFTRGDRRYDLVLDIAGSRPATACRRVLTREGTYVVVGGPAGRWVQPVGHVLLPLLMSPLVSQRMTGVDVTRSTANRENLITLTELIEDGRITPVIGRSYPFEEIPAALRHQEQGHPGGKIVITMDHTERRPE